MRLFALLLIATFACTLTGEELTDKNIKLLYASKGGKYISSLAEMTNDPQIQRLAIVFLYTKDRGTYYPIFNIGMESTNDVVKKYSEQAMKTAFPDGRYPIRLKTVNFDSVIDKLNETKLPSGVLTFINQKKTIIAKPKDKRLVFSFEYMNSTDDDITINWVSASCGCASSKTANKKILPSEGGNINVEIELESRRETLIKTAVVNYKYKGKAHEDILHMTVTVPTVLNVSPSFNVIWTRGEIGKSKTISLTPNSAIIDTPLRILSIDKTHSPDVELDFYNKDGSAYRPGKDPYPFSIKITPKQGVTARINKLHLNTNYDSRGYSDLVFKFTIL